MEQSKRRSIEYYRSAEGKVKKKALNANRKKKVSPEDIIKRKAGSGPISSLENNNSFSATLIYIRRLVSLIEGRSVPIVEIKSILELILVRQHSIAWRDRFGYIYNQTRGGPPEE